jgi:hypothetical protein
MEAYIKKLEKGHLGSLVKESLSSCSWYDPGYPESPIAFKYGYDPDNVFRDIIESFDILCDFGHPDYSVVKVKSETYFHYSRWVDDKIMKVILRRKEFYALKDKKGNYFMISKKILKEIGI